jgi:predicted site-specific integrase-resolvase
MLAPEVALPPVGYGIPEVERILGIPMKTGYKLVKEGKLEAFVDSTGKLRVSPYVLYAYMKECGELG